VPAVRNVLVVGGGAAGAAAAILLAEGGVSVELIDIKPDVGALGSGITLQGNALRVLRQLGVWDRVQEHGYGFDTLGLRAPDPDAAARLRDAVLADLKRAWQAATASGLSLTEIDARLHAERLERRAKRLHRIRAKELSDGSMIAMSRLSSRCSKLAATAMPADPLTMRLGIPEGKTLGSCRRSSKFGAKSTVFLSMSASISIATRVRRASVYR